MKSESLWSYSEGQYGCTVRVFFKRGKTNIYISWREPIHGRLERKSLGHSNQEQARREARDLSDALRLGVKDQLAVDVKGATLLDHESLKPSAAPAEKPPTWQEIFGAYEIAQSSAKKGSGPSEDRRRRKIWEHFFGEEAIEPCDLDNTAISTFIRKRREGTLAVPGVSLRTSVPLERTEFPHGNGENAAVSDRTIQADIVYLVTVLNWGASVKRRGSGGRALLPPSCIAVPKELGAGKPRRPVATHDDMRDLRRCADCVDPQLLFGCFIRLIDNLGWRVTAVCSIRCNEVFLKPCDGMPWGYVVKNARVDKTGVGDRVPLSKPSHFTLKRLLKRRNLTPTSTEYLFPAPKGKGKPWARRHVSDLLTRAEKRAGIAHLGGIHSVRRKWVTERKDHPLVDIMKAGGWKDHRSLEAYLHGDPDTTYEVVSRPTRRLRRAALAN